MHRDTRDVVRGLVVLVVTIVVGYTFGATAMVTVVVSIATLFVGLIAGHAAGEQRSYFDRTLAAKVALDDMTDHIREMISSDCTLQDIDAWLVERKDLTVT